MDNNIVNVKGNVVKKPESKMLKNIQGASYVG